MDYYICVTCGTQHPESDGPPASCPVCLDERQYVGHDGQRWTTLTALRESHRNRVRAYEPGLAGIGSEPRFAIGQRALLLQTAAGNVLWDCVSLIDEATIGEVRARGGLVAIAISHPHFYSSMIEWSRAFGAPIHLHASNRPYVMRGGPEVRYWEGESLALADGVTLVRCGGHFEGSTVLHWAQGAEGRGALLTGDTITVVPDRRYVSFMRSYPNLIPLPASAVRRIVDAVEPFAFDRVYGGWWDEIVATDGKAAVRRSADRYVRAISEPG